MKKVLLIFGSLFTIFLLVDFAIGLANTDFNYWAMEKRLSVYSNQVGLKDAIITYSEKDNGKQIYKVKVDGSYYEYQNDTESKYDELRAHDGYVSYGNEEVFFQINDEGELTVDNSKELLSQKSKYYYSKKNRIYYELLISNDNDFDKYLEKYKYRVRRYWLYYEIIFDIDSKTNTQLIIKINAFLPNSYTLSTEIKSNNENLEKKVKETVKFTYVKPRNVLKMDNKFNRKTMTVIEDSKLNCNISPYNITLYQADLSEGYYAIKPISDKGVPYENDIINYRIFDRDSIITENIDDFSNLIFKIPYKKTYKFLFSANNQYSLEIVKLENFIREKEFADTIKGGLFDLTRDIYTYSSDETKYYQIENKSENTVHILYQNNGVAIRAMDISPYSYGYYQSLSGNNELIVMPQYFSGNGTRIDYKLEISEVSIESGRNGEKIYITNENSQEDFLIAPSLDEITLYVTIQEDGYYQFYFNDSTSIGTFKINGIGPVDVNEFFLKKGEYVVTVSANNYFYGKIRME